jgi:hypothetical protein
LYLIFVATMFCRRKSVRTRHFAVNAPAFSGLPARREATMMRADSAREMTRAARQAEIDVA